MNRECRSCSESKPLKSEYFPAQRRGSLLLGYECRQCVSRRAGRYKKANREKYRKGNAAKDRTHCPKGHPLISGNLRARASGHRECLTCHRERERSRLGRGGEGQKRDGLCKRGHDLSIHRRRTRGGCSICHKLDELERSRAMGARPRWICKRGHNLQEVGQYSTGFCAECQKAKSRASRFKDGLSAQYAEMIRFDPCSYCGASGPNERDHIQPRARGGADHWSNLTAACAACNYAKRARPLLAFLCEGA